MCVRLKDRLSRAATALGIVLALWCAAPESAVAWANGPQFGEGFGTHDWVLYQANQSARQAGYDWVDWPTAQSATDDPDMVIRDFYYHAYDRTGVPYGDSPARVAELYRQAVDELRGGDRLAASRTLGLLSHYLSDTANPLHTDQSPAESKIHSRYEDALDDRTGSPSDEAALLKPHTAVPTRDAAALTVQLASEANSDYIALVSGFSAGGNTPEVEQISARALSAAVGAVADTIAGISVDAGRERGAAGAPEADAGQAAARSASVADEGRGAGSPLLATELLPGALWCVVGVVLGLALVAVLAAVVLLRKRRG